MQSNNITEDELDNIKEVHDDLDEKFKCFAHCLLDEMGFLDEMGKFDIKKWEEIWDDEHDPTFVKCKTEYDDVDDPCEYGFQITKCATGAS